MEGIMRYSISLSLAVAGLVCAASAYAGAPLKGIDVKLGKTPGGTVASRVTDANGQADFGVLPVLPAGTAYTITVGTVTEDATVTVKGAQGGPVVKAVAQADAQARVAAAPISFATDGKAPIVVVVESARKSRSNIQNN
jgi:hypothetical protein